MSPYNIPTNCFYWVYCFHVARPCVRDVLLSYYLVELVFYKFIKPCRQIHIYSRQTPITEWTYVSFPFVILYSFCLCIDRAYKGHSHLIPQFVMKQYDLLPLQYRHIGHLHMKVLCQNVNLATFIHAFIYRLFMLSLNIFISYYIHTCTTWNIRVIQYNMIGTNAMMLIWFLPILMLVL